MTKATGGGSKDFTTPTTLNNHNQTPRETGNPRTGEIGGTPRRSGCSEAVRVTGNSRVVLVKAFHHVGPTCPVLSSPGPHQPYRKHFLTTPYTLAPNTHPYRTMPVCDTDGNRVHHRPRPRPTPEGARLRGPR